MSAARKRGLRRRRPIFDDPANAWLTTYSDAITLLLAFFVMILTVSQIDVGKVEALKDGLAEMMDKNPPVTPFTEIKQQLEELIVQNELQQEVAVTLDQQGVKIELSNVALYESGSARIRDASKTILQSLAESIMEGSNGHHVVEVQGHTDDVPINTVEFPSNWELSTVRATNIVKFFIQQGIDASRLKASGFADSRPKPESLKLALPEKRKMNRRVVVFVRRY